MRGKRRSKKRGTFARRGERIVLVGLASTIAQKSLRTTEGLQQESQDQKSTLEKGKGGKETCSEHKQKGGGKNRFLAGKGRKRF